MQYILLVIFTLIFSSPIFTQATSPVSSDLPYHSIGEYPESKTAVNIIKRLIDGLGYRYYWATDSLTREDLMFKPGETNRTSYETLDHLLNLSHFILNVAKENPIERKKEEVELSWDEKRRMTLENLFEASSIFNKMSESELNALNITFKRGDNESVMSFWHLINGPIADALNHVGQIVSNRRASGNPLDPRVNVFMGETK